MGGHQQQQHQSPAFSRPSGSSVWDLPPSSPTPPEPSPVLPPTTSVWGSQPSNNMNAGQQSSVSNMINTATANNVSPSPETSPDPATDSGPEDMQENHTQEQESESNNELKDEIGVNFV